ncbi:hypothetical protein EIP91_000115 [Steccherinum ochraceum]|uniref:COQ9 C-terminal domain-containing protein n=1 Tax=Steccherinum ochraceum TaxID=92696 RepID=A0A4R0RW31_9APHY|nr:hypothetical protein EIP91_000115 [Steccherinum ochraceum]
MAATHASSSASSSPPTIREVLAARLKHNEPIVDLLPEAFALLVASSSPFAVDPKPALTHAFSVADEACHIVEDKAYGPAWYARRTSLAVAYGAAELHQFNSPNTAPAFLDSLLDSTSSVEKAVGEAGIFTDYIGRSLTGIFRSRGIL